MAKIINMLLGAFALFLTFVAATPASAMTTTDFNKAVADCRSLALDAAAIQTDAEARAKRDGYKWRIGENWVEMHTGQNLTRLCRTHVRQTEIAKVAAVQDQAKQAASTPQTTQPATVSQATQLDTLISSNESLSQAIFWEALTIFVLAILFACAGVLLFILQKEHAQKIFGLNKEIDRVRAQAERATGILTEQASRAVRPAKFSDRIAVSRAISQKQTRRLTLELLLVGSEIMLRFQDESDEHGWTPYPYTQSDWDKYFQRENVKQWMSERGLSIKPDRDEESFFEDLPSEADVRNEIAHKLQELQLKLSPQ